MAATNFTDEERACFYAAITRLDRDGLYAIIDKDADTLAYNPTSITCHETISGRPSDEELTRCLILLRLILSYGYDPQSIEIEDTFEIGGRRQEGARAIETDIIIKDPRDSIQVICEVKRIHEYKGADDPHIETQLFVPHTNIVKYSSARYLFFLSTDVPLSDDQFPLNCIGIDTSLAPTYADWSQQGKAPHLLDIVRAGETPVIRETYVKLTGQEHDLSPQFKDLRDDFGIDVLRRTWRSLWDHIWGGSLEDNKKFENFNKVLLA